MADVSTESTRVFGVGVGTFVIALTLGVSVLLCILGRGTKHPKIFVAIGIILTGIVVLILAVAPRDTVADQADAPITTRFVVGRILMTILQFLAVAAAFIGLLIFQFAPQIKAFAIEDELSNSKKEL